LLLLLLMSGVSSHDFVMGTVCAIVGAILSSGRSFFADRTPDYYHVEKQHHINQRIVHELPEQGVQVVCNISCSCESTPEQLPNSSIFGLGYFLGFVCGILCISCLGKWIYRPVASGSSDKGPLPPTLGKGSSKTGFHQSSLALAN